MLNRLRPPLWATVLTVAGVGLFVMLGAWQLGRGFYKQERAEVFANPGAAAVTLPVDVPPGHDMVRARGAGTWLGGQQLLQDGHSRGGRPGFEVWTPLRLRDGSLALVNRGWIPQPARLDELAAPPVPGGDALVEGWWRRLPQPGVRVGSQKCERVERFPAQVVYPRHQDVECLFGEPVLDGLLLLDASAPGGFVREWSAGGLPPARHFGYAVTWFALGATALALFFKLNLKPKE